VERQYEKNVLVQNGGFNWRSVRRVPFSQSSNVQTPRTDLKRNKPPARGIMYVWEKKNRNQLFGDIRCDNTFSFEMLFSFARSCFSSYLYFRSAFSAASTNECIYVCLPGVFETLLKYSFNQLWTEITFYGGNDKKNRHAQTPTRRRHDTHTHISNRHYSVLFRNSIIILNVS